MKTCSWVNNIKSAHKWIFPEELVLNGDETTLGRDDRVTYYSSEVAKWSACSLQRLKLTFTANWETSNTYTSKPQALRVWVTQNLLTYRLYIINVCWVLSLHVLFLLLSKTTTTKVSFSTSFTLTVLSWLFGFLNVYSILRLCFGHYYVTLFSVFAYVM